MNVVIESVSSETSIDLYTSIDVSLETDYFKIEQIFSYEGQWSTRRSPYFVTVESLIKNRKVSHLMIPGGMYIKYYS